MSNDAIVLLSVLLLLVLVFLKQPVWISLASSGFVGIVLLAGFGNAVGSLGSLAFTAISQFTFIVIPMFVFMGMFIERAGVAEDVFVTVARLTRRIPGGVGVATILACGMFAAVTGASAAVVASVGKLAIGEMTKHGYRRESAAALVSVAGTVGVLIPPSVLLVVFGIVAQVSIGQLLVAGVVPGVLTVLAYAIAVVVLSRTRFFTARVERDALVDATVGGGAPVTASTLTTRHDTPDPGAPGLSHTRVTGKNLIGTVYLAVVFAIVFVGIYSGIFTVTESAAVAAAASLVILWIRRRSDVRGALRATWAAVHDTGSLSTMVLSLIAGGSIFAYMVARSGAPGRLGDAIVSSGIPPLAILLAALAILLVLGAFLDSYSILILTVPVFFPVLVGLGYHEIWIAIVFVKIIELGLVTPPFGLNVFVVAGVAKGLDIGAVFARVLPLLLADLVVVIVMIAFPDIVTFLPDQMGFAR
ncbi:MAG: TRAP transporter large permease [Actinomycetales bacterium]|nr:TRAP transporter large permease [Actinomycetales bacterium]